MHRLIHRGFTLIELLVVIAIIAILAAILFPVFAQAREKARQTACLSNTKQIGMGIYQYVQDYDEMLPYGGNNVAGGYAPRWYRMVYPYVKNVGVYHCPSAPNKGGLRPALINRPSSPQHGLPNSAGSYGLNINLASWAGGSPPPSNPGRSLAEINTPADTFLVCETARLEDRVHSEANYQPEKWKQYERSASDWQVLPPSGWANSNATYYAQSPDIHGNQVRRPIPRHNEGLNIIYCDGHAKWSRISNFLGVTPARPKGWPHGDPKNSWDNQ